VVFSISSELTPLLRMQASSLPDTRVKAGTLSVSANIKSAKFQDLIFFFKQPSHLLDLIRSNRCADNSDNKRFPSTFMMSRFGRYHRLGKSCFSV